MSGIIFIKTRKLQEVKTFYLNLGSEKWLSQKNIEILRHENLLVGFHGEKEATKDVLITFFYQNKEFVDHKYEEFQDLALNKPKLNEKYNIYHFFIKDPEDRLVEFQVFLDKVDFTW